MDAIRGRDVFAAFTMFAAVCQAPRDASAAPSRVTCPGGELRVVAHKLTASEGGEVVVADAVETPDGGIVVAGHFKGSLTLEDKVLRSAGDADAFIAEIDACGGIRDFRGYGDALNQRILDVAVDTAGNRYFVGYFEGRIDFGSGALEGGGSFLVRMDPTGRVAWMHRAYEQEDIYIYHLDMLATGSAPGVFVLGSLEGHAELAGMPIHTSGLQSFVAAFDPEGRPSWNTVVTRSTDDEALAMEVDAAGHVVVAGHKSTGANLFATRLDPRGQLLWHKRFRGTGSQNETFYGLALTPDGDLLLRAYGAFGELSAPRPESDTEIEFLARLDREDGRVIWRRPVASDSTRIAVQSGGRILLAGHAADTGELTLRTLSPTGEELGARRFGGSVRLNALHVTKADQVLLAGRFTGTLDFGAGPLSSGDLPAAFVARFSP
ncbi:hypothetical protein [Polyangium jinanense]|uniref:PQQ-like beta-propeller repeat protein n=1 Tax=Polyangium jinanense TaxID=2829994 RepID=A0A9X3X920_9BACT|nr:hypothetical protein [Polyangium jinanense]MDC3958864.1 PQQ-like beta-propeller repeat protein [Polyangium jinanense]MDC3985979.1 PQQ-like beta-propeller repeat protein [Polyangium jinanense]